MGFFQCVVARLWQRWTRRGGAGPPASARCPPCPWTQAMWWLRLGTAWDTRHGLLKSQLFIFLMLEIVLSLNLKRFCDFLSTQFIIDNISIRRQRLGQTCKKNAWLWQAVKTETSLNGHDLDAMRKRLRFRNTVSEVSRSRSELSEDDGRELINKTKLLNAVEIIGGKRFHKNKTKYFLIRLYDSKCMSD